jgi:hypothetical protein
MNESRIISDQLYNWSDNELFQFCCCLTPTLGWSQQTGSRASGPPKFLVVLSMRAVSFHPGESAWAS